jgi:hypothetical protein
MTGGATDGRRGTGGEEPWRGRRMAALGTEGSPERLAQMREQIQIFE